MVKIGGRPLLQSPAVKILGGQAPLTDLLWSTSQVVVYKNLKQKHKSVICFIQYL